MKTLNREAARAVVDGLWADKERLVESVVDDGWPEKMVRAGFQRHRRTWDVEELAESVEAELSVASAVSGQYRLVWPRRVHHVWPALPGAGMTPVLMGVLLGIPQKIRPSSRGLSFARYVGSVAAELSDVELTLVGPDERWEDAPLVVVSGSDQTLDVIRRRVAGRVVGYGHRVSLAVVVDGEEVDLAELARGVAKDVVMWHQQGCFSVRAVLFCDAEKRGRRDQFCELLAEAIAACEERWDAAGVSDAQAAQRAQAVGVAQLSGAVFEAGVGYVRPVSEPFLGRQEAIHSVTVHSVAGPEEVAQAVELTPRQVQGIAIAGAWRGRRDEWLEALAGAGATRVCGVGALQEPPARWWHDGRPNALGWGRVVTVG